MKKVEKLANEIREYVKQLAYDSDFEEDELFSILDKHAPIEKPFPKEMITFCGMIVFFEISKCGTVIKPSDNPALTFIKGHKRTNWYMPRFKDCEIQVKP